MRSRVSTHVLEMTSTLDVNNTMEGLVHLGFFHLRVFPQSAIPV